MSVAFARRVRHSCRQFRQHRFQAAQRGEFAQARAGQAVMRADQQEIDLGWRQVVVEAVAQQPDQVDTVDQIADQPAKADFLRILPRACARCARPS
jgi:hypothetical protein